MCFSFLSYSIWQWQSTTSYYFLFTCLLLLVSWLLLQEKVLKYIAHSTLLFIYNTYIYTHTHIIKSNSIHNARTTTTYTATGYIYFFKRKKVNVYTQQISTCEYFIYTYTTKKPSNGNNITQSNNKKDKKQEINFYQKQKLQSNNNNNNTSMDEQPKSITQFIPKKVRREIIIIPFAF